MIPKTNEEVYREAIKVGYDKGYEHGKKQGSQAEREKFRDFLNSVKNFDLLSKFSLFEEYEKYLGRKE